MSDTIKVSPDQLDETARQLKTKSEEVEALAKSIDISLSAAFSQWEGQSKRKYEDEYKRHKKTLNTDIPNLLKDLAQNLKTIATNHRNADKA